MMISKLFILYLRIVQATSSIHMENVKCVSLKSVVGYWHGDSFTMNLALHKLIKDLGSISAVITADDRGNIIEDIINYFGGDTIRLPYDMSVKNVLRQTIKAGDNTVVATALDGPLGPLHKAKKFCFFLANKTDKNFVGVHIEYKRKLSLTRRWDHYAIPLPFNTIDIHFHDFGKISATELKQFPEFSQKIEEQLL